MERLTGKNIVITGASGGIGAEIAKLCAARGANLELLARNIDKLQLLQRDLQQHHHVKVAVFQLDVSDTDKIKEVFTQIFATIRHVDILVNNAGFGIFHAAHEAPRVDYTRLLPLISRSSIQAAAHQCFFSVHIDLPLPNPGVVLRAREASSPSILSSHGRESYLFTSLRLAPAPSD